MKKFAIILVTLLVISLPSFGQNFAAGIGAAGALPMGDFGDAVNFGFGGLGWGAYVMDPNMTLTFKTGYIMFGGKDISSGVPGVNETKMTQDWGMIPILVGGRYFFMPEGDTRFYGSADIGLYMMMFSGSIKTTIAGTTTSSDIDESESKFGIAPGVGAQFKAGDNMNIDVHLNYSMIFTEGESTSFIGFGVGLEFSL